MSFRYQPSQFAPDPWPTDGPADLSDNEYADALANIDSPYISNILAALTNTGGTTVIVWLLILGQSYTARGGQTQGYFIRSVVRDREALRRQLERLGGLTGAARGERGQLELAVAMLRPGSDERYDRVVGWGFAAQ